MKKKIAVCDDSSVVLRQTAGYFEQLQKDLPYEICPAYYSSGEEVLSCLADDTDLLLMDISMDGIDGIECSKVLRERGMKLPIIFITSMKEYALAGYAVHAFGFLTKPVTYAQFSSIIKEVFAQTEPAKPKKLLVNTETGVSIIDPDELIYAEVYQHETSFVLNDGRIVGNVQLGAVEQMLQPQGFFRCHKSYLISFRHVCFIGRDCLTMAGGDIVPLSKHRRKAFLDAYSAYMGVHL